MTSNETNIRRCLFDFHILPKLKNSFRNSGEILLSFFCSSRTCVRYFKIPRLRSLVRYCCRDFCKLRRKQVLSSIDNSCLWVCYCRRATSRICSRRRTTSCTLESFDRTMSIPDRGNFSLSGLRR